jgi:hypothetical protein
MKFYGRNNIEFEPFEKEKHERWDREERKTQAAAVTRLCAHESAHAVGRFFYGGRIKKMWRAEDFSKVPRGEPLGECLYAPGPRKLIDFQNIVVGIIGEAADALLFNYRSAHNFAPPWKTDAAGNLSLRGQTPDWVDAFVLARKISADDPAGVMLRAWGVAIELVKEFESEIRELGEMLNRAGELSGEEATAFLDEKREEREEYARKIRAKMDELYPKRKPAAAETPLIVEHRYSEDDAPIMRGGRQDGWLSAHPEPKRQPR